MIGCLPLLLIAGVNLLHVGTGDGFIPLSPDMWPDPLSIHGEFVSTGDTLVCEASARGSVPVILLNPVPAVGDTVLITFDTLSVDALNTAALRLQPVHSETAYQVQWSGVSSDPVPEGLFISGTKQLGVSVGSGGGITQGTELSIQGMLSSGITVDGRITDRNLPLGAGASEALSELDRVYLKLDGGRWNAELGDLQWKDEDPVSWSADPSGFHAGVTPFDPVSVTGGYGTSGSERRSTNFLTTEGVQGPYQFAPDGGVTPGSERVFLDGELMNRGAGSDYTVEYAAGQITFNTGRLIIRDQRVDVSWYREGDGFRKNIYTGGLLISSEESMSMDLRVFSQGDDVDVPLGFVMSDQVKEVLETAGEDPSDAWIDGGTFVGAGNGSYTLDSLLIYRWAGPGLGDWTVEFQKPPEGPGDYVYDSASGGYLWAGDSIGTHLARRYLSIPARERILTAELSGVSGILESYAVHSTFSERSGNLFNTEGTTRQGSLTGGAVSLRPWQSGPLFTAEGRFVSSGFTPPEELDPDSELLRWGLPAGWQGNDSFVRVGAAGKAVSFTAGRRSLENGGSSSIAETSFTGSTGGISVTFSADGVFRNRAEDLTDGSRGVFSADLSLAAGALTPFMTPTYTAESWPDSLSGAVAGVVTGLRHTGETWRSELSVGGETDRRWGIAHPDRTLRIILTGTGSAEGWNTSGTASHSTGWYPQGGTTSADAIRFSWSRRFGGTWIHTRYTAGGYISREMDMVYTWVGEGNGDYSYDPDTGEYYADPSGDYMLTWVSGEGDTRVLEAKLTGGFSWSDSGSVTGVDGSFTLEASDPDDRLLTYTTAGAFDTDNPGRWSGTVSPWITWEENLLSRLSLRLEGHDSVEEFSGSGLVRETGRLIELSPVLQPSDDVVVESNFWAGYGRQAIYGVRLTEKYGLSADPVYLFGTGLETGLELSWEQRSESTDDISGTAWGIEPHGSLSSSGWTAKTRFAATAVISSNQVPSWLFDGMTEGWTLEPSVSVSRNLREWLRLTAFYWGRQRPGTDWEQRGGLEGTVNF